jgi:hypothetical protein
MGGCGAEQKKTDASQRGGALRLSHSGTCRLEIPLGCLSGSRGKNADPSARETSSAKAWMRIFSIT